MESAKVAADQQNNPAHCPAMSETAALDRIITTPSGPPTAARPTIPTKDGNKRIGVKLKCALDLMVYGNNQGEPVQWNEAAKTVGLSLNAMRKALEKTHVLRYLKEQKQVFRSSVSAANILVARQIRDEGKNDNARIKAIEYLDEISTKNPHEMGVGRTVQPGVTVVVNVQSSGSSPVDDTVIEINPGGAQTQGTEGV